MARGRGLSQFFPASRPRLPWTQLRIWCALTAVTGLALSPALVILPDPLWIAGLYDGADYDDLIDSGNHIGSVEGEPSSPGGLSLSGSVSRPDEVAATRR